MWQVSVPIRVPISKKNSFPLNLNAYRNAHHHTLNTAKVNFAALVTPTIGHLPVLDKTRISYILYPKTARNVDVSNVCSIVDKFFSDVLVSAKKIPDDNYRHLIAVAYGYGDIDRINPRVDIIIEPM